MSIVAVDPRTKQEFVPESEKKKKEKTKFFFLPMLETEKAKMAMRLPGGKGRLPEGVLVQLVTEHIVGWENFADKNKKKIEFNPQNIERIPWIVLVEFGAHILSSSGFGTAERKN